MSLPRELRRDIFRRVFLAGHTDQLVAYYGTLEDGIPISSSTTEAFAARPTNGMDLADIQTCRLGYLFCRPLRADIRAALSQLFRDTRLYRHLRRPAISEFLSSLQHVINVHPAVLRDLRQVSFGIEFAVPPATRPGDGWARVDLVINAQGHISTSSYNPNGVGIPPHTERQLDRDLAIIEGRRVNGQPLDLVIDDFRRIMIGLTASVEIVYH